MKIPKDEGILLRREPTFTYGLLAGGGVTLLSTAPSVASDYFIGFAFTAGGHIGYHISRNITVRFEGAYTGVNGSNPSVPQALNFGFIEGDLSLSYYVDDIELYAGLQYAYGVSIGSDIPTRLALPGGAADVSTIAIQAGAGYRIPLGDVSNLVLRARYSFGFLREPVGFQNILAIAFLEFRG